MKSCFSLFFFYNSSCLQAQLETVNNVCPRKSFKASDVSDSEWVWRWGVPPPGAEVITH